LFFDPVLSGDGRIACNACHEGVLGLADGRPRPKIDSRPEGVINTPTLFNVGHNTTFNWNAKFSSLEDQVSAPIKNPIVMNANWPDIVAKLRALPPYPAEFAVIYPTGITERNVANALAEYERSLDTPDARFDRWLGGDASAMSAEETEGFRLFKSYGCASCHQ